MASIDIARMYIRKGDANQLAAFIDSMEETHREFSAARDAEIERLREALKYIAAHDHVDCNSVLECTIDNPICDVMIARKALQEK